LRFPFGHSFDVILTRHSKYSRCSNPARVFD